MAGTHVYTATDPYVTLRTASQSDHKQEPLMVIDSVTVQGTTTADSTLGFAIDDGNVTIYSAISTIEAGTTDTVHITWDGGFPCWKQTGSAALQYSTPEPATVVSFSPTYGDGTGIITIVYHFERPGARR